MKNNQTLKSFAVLSTITAVIAIILTCAVLGFSSFSEIKFYNKKSAENIILSTAVSVAETIDGDIIANLKPGDEETPYYIELARQCDNIRKQLNIEYIYILARVPGTEYGKYVFIYDTDLDEPVSINEPYDIDEFETIEAAFNGQSGISDIYEDEWGVFMSGYAPLRDNSGKIIAVTVTDYNMETYQNEITNTLISYIFRCLIITVIILAIFTGITFINYSKIKSKLVFVITQMRDFSKNIIGSVNIFDNRSVSMSEKTNETSDAISEMSANLEKISSEIKTTDDNMHKAANYFSKVSNNLSNGTKKISGLSESINDIENSGDEITGVIEIINSIAKKTKILAINAEVESAKVGETGKSFAVVAQEVGNLAQNVENAAKNTSMIIDRNKNHIKKAVENTEGVKEIILSIEKEINDLNGIISEVSEASSKQTEKIVEIRGEVSTIKNAASENVSSAEAITSSAHELASMTDNLNEHVNEIKNTITNKLTI